MFLFSLMDDQNSNNSGITPTDSSQTAEMASDKPNSAGGSGALSGSTKKPKTEKQKEKERERRRRRRRKQKSVNPAGKDVPLILSENIADKRGFVDKKAEVKPIPIDAEQLVEAPEAKELEKELVDAPLIPKPEPEIETELMPDAPIIEEETEAPAATEIMPEDAESVEEPQPVAAPAEDLPIIEPESTFTNSSYLPPEAPADQAVVEDPHGLPELPSSTEPDHSQEVFEEEYKPVEAPEDLSVGDLDETSAAEHHEEELLAETARLEAAKKLNEDLVTEPDDLLEEVPVQKGFLGKIFDVIAAVFEKKPKEAKEVLETSNTTVEPVTEIKEASELAEPKPSIVWPIIRNILSIVVFLAVLIGAFWLGASLHLVDTVTGWFKAKPGLELTVGNNDKVNFDAEMIRRSGFYTAKVFGANGGDQRYRMDAVFYNAYYFGKLKDPISITETGFSAAIYYGFGRDMEYARNKFVYYVRYLAKVRNANQVDVGASLNGKLRRDEALDQLTADLQAVFDEGNKLRKEINVQIDDLKVSVNSLNPDKDRYEADFFSSLEKAEAEKASLLIDKFIESSQKQIELKAKLAALTQLSADYENDLINLKLKLEGITKNRAALIEGVTVTEVPGSNINLVNK